MSELPQVVMASTSACSDVTRWVKINGQQYRCTCCNWMRSFDQLIDPQPVKED